MSHIVDDDPPIKTHAASQAYRDNWDRMFGQPEEPVVITIDHRCETCRALVPDPETHAAQGHTVTKL